MLQGNTFNKTLRDMITKAMDKDRIVEFLLKLAQFENQFDNMIRHLVKEKSNLWQEDKEFVVEALTEISLYFKGERAWDKGEPDEGYADWFADIANSIEELDYKKSNRAGSKIQNVVKALEQITMYDNVESSDTTKSYITKAIAKLLHMVRISSLKKQMLINISTIIDFSYAWKAIDDYIPIIQGLISQDPKTVLLLKTVYTKMASIMNFPLKRIIEYNSDDVKVVAKFYSGELVKFVKRTLSIIPTNIFEKLEEISVLLIRSIGEMETKILKERLKEFACFEERYILAKRTHEISMLTEGMLVLDKTLMGIIELDPKEILVDGIRKELGRNLANMLHEGFIFEKGQETLESKFQMLKEKFSGLKRSLEYIQDFLNIEGE